VIPARIDRARQKQNQIRNLLRLADAPEWMRRFASLHEGGVILFVHSGIQKEICANDAGIYGVSRATTFWGKLQCGTPRK